MVERLLKRRNMTKYRLWGELYGSINIAEINDGAITREQAEFLRNKYLFGGKHDRND